MPGPPKLTEAQRAAARAKAVEVRVARRAFKDRVAAEAMPLAAAIAAARADDALAGIRMADLLQCLPRVGPTRAAELMASAGISPGRRVRGVGPHQVQALVREWGA